MTSHVAYAAIDDSDSEKGELQRFLEPSLAPEDVVPRFARRKYWPLLERLWSILPWFLAIFFASLSAFLLLERDHSTGRYGSYEDGFDSDMIPASQIPLEQVRFKGSPHFTSNGTGWLDPMDEDAPWPENMVLFGPPSPEVDDNWARLIGSRYFSISDEEATRAWGEDRYAYVEKRFGGYSAGLEVFHTLHCVNALRKSLYPDYYHAKHPHGPFHLEHCLDALRQTIQCYGSTTLIPTRYWPGLHHNYIDSDQVHTCRSFSFLRDFVTSREPGREGYVERDQSVLEHAKAWRAKKYGDENKFGDSQ
ncbi:hypothetical protein GQ53DRAFT_701340 [Thozetella sp. PMI_491]|nr:hypothetical protein GQ53DRAFT_701340 [Thozetella sp. PMI_491]